MRLYFSPMACSMATRIALYEAGADAEFVAVDPKTKRLADGSDYLAINPMGMVPVLADEGWLLTENTAILPWIAGRYPEAKLLPEAPKDRARTQQWLGFINSELHKTVFMPLLDRTAGEAVKAYARAGAARRMEVLQQHLQDREYLMDDFSVADAYLITVLNWAAYCDVDLATWPAVESYLRRLRQRPSVTRALQEEWDLYRRQAAH